MKEITKGVLIGLITAAIIAGLGYIWLVRENQLRIQIMQRDMEKLSSQVEIGNNSFNTLKLFVVSMHPDKSIIPIASANKLKKLEPKELATLSAHIGKYSSAKAFSQRVSNDDPNLGSLLKHYEMDQNDLRNYWNVAKGQVETKRDMPLIAH